MTKKDKPSFIGKIIWLPDFVGSPISVKQWMVWFYYFFIVVLLGKVLPGMIFIEKIYSILSVIFFFNILPYQICRLVAWGFRPKPKVIKKKEDKDHNKFGFYAKLGRDFAKFLKGFNLDFLDNSKFKLEKIKAKDIFWLAPIIVLIIGIFPLPIGYYNLTRLVVTASSIYFAYSFYRKKDTPKTWIFGFLTVLYNPIVPVYLYEKEIWIIVNIITMIAFYYNKEKIK